MYNTNDTNNNNNKNGDCLFCKIVAGEIPSTKVFEDGEFLAFNDINPAAPVHFLVVPKKHIPNIMEINGDTDVSIMGKLLNVAQSCAKKEGLEEKGARFVINCKDDGLQSVPHIHVHVLGGRKLGWPPG